MSFFSNLFSALFAYIIFWLALPFLLTHPKVRHGIRERLALYSPRWPKILGRGPRLWLHGASAGDIIALMPLVKELNKIRPDIEIIASTITNSGRTISLREKQSFSAITYLPYDLPGSVGRAFKRMQPDLLLIEYTELWPNLIIGAHQRQIPVVLHNGRFAADKMGGYRRLFFFCGNLLKKMTLLLMRDEHEAARAEKLGALIGTVKITGNTKFDNLTREQDTKRIDALRRACGLNESDPVWVAGSTHEGEEGMLFDIFKILIRDIPDLKMILAPRYAERADRIVTLAKQRGLTVSLRSEEKKSTQVTVLNTIGELSACYSLADVVFVGGSFVKRGGQNILEPAVCAKPVIFGPYMKNFADSVQVLLGRGGIQVASEEQLQRILSDLLQHPRKMKQLGTMARKQVLNISGAAKRNATLIAALLPTYHGGLRIKTIPPPPLKIKNSL